MGVRIVKQRQAPFIPDYWTVVEFKKSGRLQLDLTKIRRQLSKLPKDGQCMQGHKLCKVLKDRKVANVDVPFYLLAHPKLIPTEWKGRSVFFWATFSGITRCVEYLCWEGDGWVWDVHPLGNDQFSLRPIVPA